MLGIEDYGSDVESGDEGSKTTSITQSAPSSSLLSKLPPPATKPSFALPPAKSSSSLYLPAPSGSTSRADATTVPHKQKRTKKIAINLPSLPAPDDDEGEDGPPSKKPRTSGSGAGKSSLLSMLPAPTQPTPVIAKKKEEERVLGGGTGPGLVFRTQTTSIDGADGAEVEGPVDVGIDLSGSSTTLVPPSLKKGRANISLEDQGLKKSHLLPSQQKSAAPPPDFFSLGSGSTAMSSAKSTPTPTLTPSVPAVSSAPSTSSFALSSAPSISTFQPPTPTLDDPYPGYYQLPSGAYAPYEAEYYASYARKWKADYDKHIRELEKSQYEPETDSAQGVDMAVEMEKARREIKEREDRKALTTGKANRDEDGEPEMPRMNVKGAKLGAVARSRHQLTTLLTEAYLNREALEEKIAQGRRNRKEAGNKYGF